MGPISEERLATVHPKLAALIHTLDTQMSEPLGVTQGRRDDAEQEALYAQGRGTLELVNHLRELVGWAPITAEENAETVTDAKPGYSWHGPGLAVDVVPLDSSQDPDWDSNHPVWKELVEKGEALGLTSGISWHDEPHFQLTGRFGITPDDEVRQLMASGGVEAVWAASGI